MNVNKLLKVGKVVVALASVGVTVAQGYFNKRELEDTVAKKVAEAMSDQAKES